MAAENLRKQETTAALKGAAEQPGSMSTSFAKMMDHFTTPGDGDSMSASSPSSTTINASKD
jgi:hypothetical protein